MAQARKSLLRAIESYLAEVHTRRGNKAAKRTKWLLELFASVTKKHYVDEIARDTLFLFMAYLKDNGKSPKTLRDRMGSIETFLQRHGISKLMKKGDLPKVTKKIVDCYTEEEVTNMLVVADEHERFLIQFLLATGVREQERFIDNYQIKVIRKISTASNSAACRPYDVSLGNSCLREV